MNINELKQLLLKAIDGYNSKSYTRVLTRTYPSLAQEIRNVTAQFNPTNLNESIYILLKEEPKICPNGKKPLFSSYEKGYRIGCGQAASCQCVKDSQREKMFNWHDTITDEKKEQMTLKAKETFVKNYGVDNPMKVDEFVEKLKNTNQEKYGSDYTLGSDIIKERIKQTNIEKYGVASPFENPEIQEKIKQTTLERYGGLMTHAREASYKKYNGNNPFTDEEVKAKRVVTMVEKYNTPHALSNKEIFDKMIKNNIEKYGYPNVMHKHYKSETWKILNDPIEFAKVIKNKNSMQISMELDINSSIVLRYARKYNILDQMVFEPLSAMEDDLKDWLIQQDIPFKQHDRTVLSDKREIDFLFKDFNFGIELNSFTIHSELQGGKDSNYHLQKYIGCNMNNIHLLQYWQDEYWKGNNIVKSKILYLTNRIKNKIHARKVKLKVIEDTNEERDFLELNHIQGFADYRQHSMGAYYDDRLIGVMCFSNTTGRMDLIRYATDINMVSSGLFTRMLKQSVNDFKLSGKITSLSDNRHSDGNVYYRSGWTFAANSESTYSYTDYKTRFNKQTFTKDKIAKRFGIDSDTMKKYTEWEIMQELGYDRIWDVGKKRWTINV